MRGKEREREQDKRGSIHRERGGEIAEKARERDGRGWTHN